MLNTVRSIYAPKTRTVDNNWFYLSGIIMLKSMFFLSMLHTENSAGISLLKMYFSAPPIITHIMMIIALMSFAFLFGGKSRVVFYIAVDLLITVLLLSDLFYYRSNGNFLSLRHLMDVRLFNPMDRTVIKPYPLDIVFVFDFIIFSVLRVRSNSNRMVSRDVRAFALIFSLSIVYISSSHFLIDKADITKGRMDLFQTSWAPFQTMSSLSPLGYHGFDIYKEFTENKRIVLSGGDRKEINEWLENNKEILPDNEYKGMLKGKNLIAIQVESLENFVIGQRVAGQEITPNINRLLRNSLYFDNIYEQNNNGTSSDADLLINTSIFPVREGATFLRYPDRAYNSLPKLLQSLNYSTVSTHPEIGGNWNWAEAHRASLGFDTIFDVNSYKKDELIRNYLSDGTLLKQYEEKLKNIKNPFYAYLVTMSSHGPFELEDKYKYLKLDKQLEDTILGAYFQSIRYVDEQIGLFIDRLKQDGLLQGSVVVVYGDHTGVHKFYNEKLSSVKLEGNWWKADDKKIPLVIYGEGLQKKTISTIGGHVDIMPTLAYMLGIPNKEFESTVMGKILVKTNRDFTLLNNSQIVGTPPNESERNHMVKALEISDKIIQGDYFREK